MTRLAKKPKYRNVKCEFNGQKFDSKAEMAWYVEELYPLELSGAIKVEFQPVFELIPKHKHFKDNVRAGKYVADFRVTYKDGEVRIYDVKSKITKTPLYKWKRKLLHYQNPTLYIIEVERIKGGWKIN